MMHDMDGMWHWGFGFGHWIFGVLIWFVVIFAIALFVKTLLNKKGE